MVVLLALLACATEPDITTEVLGDDLSPGVILGSLMGNRPQIFLSDREGFFAWTWDCAPGSMVPEVARSRDGETLLFNEFAMDRSVDTGTLWRVDLMDTTVESIRTEEAHHAFEELPDGTLAWLAVDIRTTDTWGDVVGDRIVERAPDGTTRDLFSTWDWFEVEENDNFDAGFYPQGHDWTHGDSLSWSQERDSYLISFRNLDMVAEVDRSTGTLLDVLGGEDSTYTFDPPESAFTYPHSVQWLDSGHLLLTSSGEHDGAMQTWASEYQVDREAGVLTEVWTYGRGEGYFAYALGGARRLESGNTLVNWGTVGLLREITPDGQVVWEMKADMGNYFGRTTLVQDPTSLLF